MKGNAMVTNLILIVIFVLAIALDLWISIQPRAKNPAMGYVAKTFFKHSK